MLNLKNHNSNLVRIGIDCRMYSVNFTGIGRYVYELIKRLPELDGGKNEYFLFFNSPEYQSFKSPSQHFHKILVNTPHYSLKEQTAYLKILNSYKLDLMHFTHFNAPIFYKRPFIVTIHDLTLSFYPGKKMRSWYHRLAYHFTIKHAIKDSRHVIAVSNNTKKDIKKLFPIKDDKISVIYEGVNREFFERALEKEKSLILEKYNIKTPFFLYTGVWRDHKNLARLIKAFYLLKQEHHIKAQLVITGKPNPYYPEVQNAVDELGLRGDVVFPGMVPENNLVALYQSADLYVFPSLYEGFGLSLLEAMSCSLPVVASNAASIPEICGPDNAVLFNPLDEKDMAKKIYQVYSNADLQTKLKKRGLERVKEFSWLKMAEETHKIHLNSSK